MKTILEFRDENMEKLSIDAAALPAMMLVPPIMGGLAGKLYSDVTAPPARQYESFQSDLLKERLKNLLRERAKKKKINKLEEVLNGTRRSIRI